MDVSILIHKLAGYLDVDPEKVSQFPCFLRLQFTIILLIDSDFILLVICHLYAKLILTFLDV